MVKSLITLVIYSSFFSAYSANGGLPFPNLRTICETKTTPLAQKKSSNLKNSNLSDVVIKSGVVIKRKHIKGKPLSVRQARVTKNKSQKGVHGIAYEGKIEIP